MKNPREPQTNHQQLSNTPQSAPSESDEAEFGFEDLRPETIQRKKRQEDLNNRPEIQALKAEGKLGNQRPPVFQLQASTPQSRLQPAQDAPTRFRATPDRPTNNTGLPPQLKSGIENLSGYSMDDVKVHYNSDKPAQLQAHGYAQGTEIHLGSGQEKHLPHEAWHIVQQKQGRVQANHSLTSGKSGSSQTKTKVNNDPGLEKEADKMGQVATQRQPEKREIVQKPNSSKVVQLQSDEETSYQEKVEDLKQLIQEHKQLAGQWMKPTESKNKDPEQLKKVELAGIFNPVNKLKNSVEELKTEVKIMSEDPEKLKKKGIETATSFIPIIGELTPLKKAWDAVQELRTQFDALSFLNAWDQDEETAGHMEALKKEIQSKEFNFWADRIGWLLKQVTFVPLLGDALNYLCKLVGLVGGSLIESRGEKKGKPASTKEGIFVQGRTKNHHPVAPHELKLVNEIIQIAGGLGHNLTQTSVIPNLGVEKDQMDRIRWIISGSVPYQAFGETSEDKVTQAIQSKNAYGKHKMEQLNTKGSRK